jgi:phosphoglycerol transferase MdoB-like AlkP superfamily enzyme
VGVSLVPPIPARAGAAAMPAVLASMPTLMETPYITSQYASNKLDGVGFMLKDKGYSSAFFHSAAKGSMNFDGFAALIGLEQYFGKADYPNQDHFDGTWGIFDHYFLPWCAKKMSEMKQPFFNSIFTSTRRIYIMRIHFSQPFKIMILVYLYFDSHQYQNLKIYS